jgi:hypothetical protein
MQSAAFAHQRVPLGSSLKEPGTERENAGVAVKVKTALYSAAVVLGLVALSIVVMILLFYLVLPRDSF